MCFRRSAASPLALVGIAPDGSNARNTQWDSGLAAQVKMLLQCRIYLEVLPKAASCSQPQFLVPTGAHWCRGRRLPPTCTHPACTHPSTDKLLVHRTPQAQASYLTPSFAGGAGTPDQVASIQGHPFQRHLSQTPGYRH